MSNDSPYYRRGELPGFIINQAAKFITDLLHENFKLENQEVTPEQWIILDELWNTDGLSQLELAKATFRQETSTSRILNNLVKRNLVYRSKDPQDQRKNRIYLTEMGISLQKDLIAIVNKTMNDAVAGVNEEELKTCLNVLNEISANISN